MPYDDFLKKVPLFAELPDNDLEQLCMLVETVELAPGEQLFAEGDAGDRAYVVKEGQLEVLKAAAGRDVLIAVVKSGEIIGEQAVLENQPRNATIRARLPSRLLVISQEQLERLLVSSPSAARRMLQTMSARLRSTETLLRQSGKMAQLGTLSAGMAHELNNPAAAAQRGADQLRTAVAAMQQAQMEFVRLSLTSEQLDLLATLDEAASSGASNPTDLDSLERSDQEYEIETWLDHHGIPNPWDLAPGLLNLGYQPERLGGLADQFSAEQLPAVITWLNAVYTVYTLLMEIAEGTGRISEIVKALKNYVYLDQAPVQTVNVREGLDNTLVLLRHKLKKGVQVRREYAADLPPIEAYASELNQVWTNIIDNAAGAMEGQGELVLRTRREGDWVIVEIEDNGPGIPPHILPMIFDPFFTTKAPGQGTGLGLNITYNIIVQKHKGEVKVFSEPGKTCFQVWLPLRLESAIAPRQRPPAQSIGEVGELAPHGDQTDYRNC